MKRTNFTDAEESKVQQVASESNGDRFLQHRKRNID
jgi:hypothetical protein